MTHLHIASLFTNSNNYVIRYWLLEIMELFVQILFYMISNAPPEVRAWGQKETLSRLMRNLTDLRVSPIINATEGGVKVVEGEDDGVSDNKDADISRV